VIATVVPEEYTNTYNRLGDVEEADAVRHAHQDFDDFLKDFARLAWAHGLMSSVGVVLLHRHFNVCDGQVMLETFEPTETGRPALVSRARSHCADGVPVRWQWTGTRFFPLEYSTDPGAKRNFRALDEAPRFLPQCAKLLKTYGMDDLLGVALPERDGVKPREGEIYTERNTDVASVVTAEAKDAELEAGAIITTWAPVRLEEEPKKPGEEPQKPDEEPEKLQCVQVCRCMHDRVHRRSHE
jgi:hypothetical protein